MASEKNSLQGGEKNNVFHIRATEEEINEHLRHGGAKCVEIDFIPAEKYFQVKPPLYVYGTKSERLSR